MRHTLLDVPYLELDLARAATLAGRLTAGHSRVEPIASLVRTAELLADVATMAGGFLDEIVDLLVHTAARVELAIEKAGTPLNQIHQLASHNTYAEAGGIAALHAKGVYSFELDLHRGAPTRLRPPWLAPPHDVLIDHLTHHDSRSGDWHVFHHSLDTRSEYEFLSDGLRELASLSTSKMLTLFLDAKDPLRGHHDSAQLDAAVREVLGDRLYTPGDLLARAPGAATLHQAIEDAGWPTDQELHGRVIVVITDEIMDYPRLSGDLFVAPRPEFDTGPDGTLGQVSEENVVFYNAHRRDLSVEAIAAIHRAGNIVRTHGHHHCHVPNVAGSDRSPAIANYRAADLGRDDECPPRGPAPPRGTPVPIAGDW